MTRRYERTGETVHTRVLDSGLRVSLLEKQGFSRSFALLATDFGSCDARFTFEGQRVTLPAGVAHFLEHKLFEGEDGNALQKFTATGAAPNAFTSHTTTAYHFSCTERLEENLTLLLRFVTTPWFTEENVRKEQGIIGQEIGMLEDSPGFQAYCRLFAALFREHPIRTPIAGSCDSIAQITPELLYTCHRAFYAPQNLALVVCGELDFDALCRTAETLIPARPSEAPMRDYGTRRPTVATPVVARELSVSRPSFALGIKDDPLASGERRLRRQVLGDLCCRLLCGPASPLYARLTDERLITPSFDQDYMIFPEGAAPIFTGEGRDPLLLRDRLTEALARLADGPLDEDAFVRTRNAVRGVYLRAMDDPGSYCRQQAAALFAGEDFAAFGDCLDALTAEDALSMLRRWAQPARCALSIITPKGGMPA